MVWNSFRMARFQLPNSVRLFSVAQKWNLLNLLPLQLLWLWSSENRCFHVVIHILELTFVLHLNSWAINFVASWNVKSISKPLQCRENSLVFGWVRVLMPISVRIFRLQCFENRICNIDMHFANIAHSHSLYNELKTFREWSSCIQMEIVRCCPRQNGHNTKLIAWLAN